MLEKESFQNPPSFYRSAPFWSLNDKLESAELKRQIREFNRMGMGGVFLHPRGGMQTRYLSEEFFAALHDCMDELEKLDMLGWLYDEDKFPSGVAGGKVVKSNPEFGQKVIVSQICDAADFHLSESVIALFVLKEGSHERISPGQLPRSGKILSVSMVSGAKQARFDNTSNVDICNKDAIDYFIRITHDKYYDEFKASFGKSIRAIFTDEPHFNPNRDSALPWTPSFPGKFLEKNGYDILDRLSELFYDIGNYRKTRFDYWDLITSLAVEAYSKNIFDWCEEKGIAYTGHFWEHVFPSPLSNGSVMPHYEYMQYPGIDMLFVSDSNSPNMYGNDFNVKEVSSVANQLGRERVLSETHGASGWGLDFAYQKRAVDWQLVLGINLFSQHLSLYSMTGYRKRDFPLSFLDHQPWWDNYKILADYMGRLSYAMSQGKYQADVLVLHPSSSTWVNFTPMEKGSRTLETIGSSAKTLVKNLNQLQVMFDLGDDIILSKHGKTTDGKLSVGQMDYKVVILPQMHILREEVFGLLKEFANQGGSIITTGETPALLNGVHSEELVKFFESSSIVKVPNEKASLLSALEALNPERIQLQEMGQKDLSNVYAHVRRHKNTKTVFLCNLDMEQKVSLRMFIDHPCHIEQLNGETGESRTCEVYTGDDGRFYVSVALDALNSTLFLFHEDRKAEPAKEIPGGSVTSSVELSGWLVELKDKNALNLQFCRASLNHGPYGQLEDVLAVDDRFKTEMGLEKGHVQLRQPWMYTPEEKEKTAFLKAEYPFTVKEVPSGDVWVAAELPDTFTLYINDRKLSPMGGFYKDRAFVLYNIKPYVKTGENVIRLESEDYGILVNLESVYIVGDFKLSEDSSSFSICECTRLSTGNIVEQGYPYYSGLISYSSEVTLDNEFREAVLNFGPFDGVTAVVTVNGSKAGTIGWKPYSVDITKYLKKGRNVINIEIANSLQNLLGPFDSKSNLQLVTPSSFYTDKHTQFTPLGFSGFAEIVIKPGK